MTISTRNSTIDRVERFSAPIDAGAGRRPARPLDVRVANAQGDDDFFAPRVAAVTEPS
jgi:hypothetical protein